MEDINQIHDNAIRNHQRRVGGVIRFRRNVKSCMRIKNISLRELVEKYCDYMKKSICDNDRKKISRLIYSYQDSRKYITLEDVKCFSTILDISPCILAWGSLDQIEKTLQ